MHGITALIYNLKRPVEIEHPRLPVIERLDLCKPSLVYGFALILYMCPSRFILSPRITLVINIKILPPNTVK